MKNLLMIFGGLFIFAFTVVIILSKYGNRLDKESKEYTELIISPMLSSCTPDNIYKYMASEAKNEIKTSDIEKICSDLSDKFGTYQSYADVNGESLMSAILPNGVSISANYAARLHFDKGSPLLRLSLVKTNEAWAVSGFWYFIDNKTQLSPQ